MYKMKVGIALTASWDIPVEEQIRMVKRIGFEAFATSLDTDEALARYRAVADECGMVYQYMHAPFLKAADMWTDCADDAVAELIRCADACAKFGVPIMVVHAFIGFVKPSPDVPADFFDVGIKNYRRVAEHARALGVKVAVENTEGEEYLAALMSALAGLDNVGFCWDTGHEMCYNLNRDMTALYGDRLLVTHLNDNLGVSDFNGEITWLDDLHLLPFDGVADFNDIARRIVKSRPIDVLMFELNKKNKPDRLCNSKYEKLSLEEYLTEAYARACRVASLVLLERGQWK
ncbi:MAG: sugar phosphate isomerase/epimerase [Clostridia bacterium]|nr:sugar phosphate isomerase/epimerase [Clostridia bacterium]